MNKRSAYARFSLLPLALLPALAMAAPQQVHATYDLYRNNLKIGTVTETFHQADGRYRIESITAPAGIAALVVHQTITATSTGRVAGNRLMPTRFEQRNSASADKTLTADFDWAHHKLTMHHDGKIDTASLPSRAQDRLSLMYQMMLAPPKGRYVAVSMTTGKKLESAAFHDLGRQTLDLPGGAVATRHLSRPRTADVKGMDVWLAPSKENLPVRIRMTDNNDSTYFEQRLTSARISP